MKKLTSMVWVVAVLLLTSCVVLPPNNATTSNISNPVSRAVSSATSSTTSKVTSVGTVEKNTGRGDTDGSAKLYITSSALPGDGSGMMPGTFILPNSTKVPLGSVVQEGAYLYTAGSAKIVDAAYNVDYLASAEQARMVCREALSNYLNSSVNASSSRSSSSENGMNKTKSSTSSYSSSSALLAGMEDCGYSLSPDGTSYLLVRVKNQ